MKPGTNDDFWRLNYAGAVILAASILGGGAGQGYWTDHIVEILMIPAMFFGFTNLFENRLDTGSRIFVLVVMVFMALQFLPVAIPHGLPLFEGMEHVPIWTVSPEKSLNSVLFLASLLGFGLFVATFSDKLQIRLIKFIFLGLALNFLIGLVQLSYSEATTVNDYFPFPITSALFSNANHLSTFTFMIIPIIAWRFLSLEARPLTYIAIVIAIIGFLFAVGSRAGMGLSAGLAIFCLFWFMLIRKRIYVRFSLLLAGALVMALFIIFNGLDNALEGDLRQVFFRNTLIAIKDNWLTGTGLGTFTMVYPYYLPEKDIIDVYANHAHNDILEFVLEGGVLGGLILIAAALLILKNMFRTPLAEAAALSVFSVTIHSIVDYPVRTFAVAATSAVMLAIITSVNHQSAGNVQSIRKPDM